MIAERSRFDGVAQAMKLYEQLLYHPKRAAQLAGQKTGVNEQACGSSVHALRGYY
jgi:hypothetical protein